MAPTPPLGPYVGMSDEEMRAFLKASCGVEDCDLKAHALFDAATALSYEVVTTLFVT